MPGTKGHSGRKQKPIDLKLVEGNRGHRPINKRSPRPKKGSRAAPSSLCKVAKAKYKVLVADLKATGLLPVIDVDSLSLYCDAYARYWDLQKQMAKESAVIDDKKNPKLTAMKEAFVQMRSIGSEFGWSPATRATLNTDSGGDDELDALLK